MFDLFIPPILYGILFYLSSIMFIYVTIGYQQISVYFSRTGMFAWTLIAMVPNLLLSILLLLRGIFTMVFILTISILLFVWMYSNIAILKFEKIFLNNNKK